MIVRWKRAWRERADLRSLTRHRRAREQFDKIFEKQP